MTKETLTLEGVSYDFKEIAKFNMSNVREWRLLYIIPLTLLAMIITFFLKKYYITAVIFLIIVYHIIRYILEYIKYRKKINIINQMAGREDICISLEKFTNISDGTIYEPHINFYTHLTLNTRRFIFHALKPVNYFCFFSGRRWRIPDGRRFMPNYCNEHYKWSKDFYISSEGLHNISLFGDEFYFVSLKGSDEISYIYPCKNFVLDSSLNVNI